MKIKLIIIVTLIITSSFILACSKSVENPFDSQPEILAKVTVALFNAKGNSELEKKIFDEYNLDTISGKKLYYQALNELKTSPALKEKYEKARMSNILTDLGSVTKTYSEKTTSEAENSEKTNAETVDKNEVQVENKEQTESNT